jgi:TetR/AcrR family transcriptional repressor of nem operon
MARPREFDSDVALDRALDVFWTKGYEATSLDDLCEVTGLSRSSLYGAFGSKKNLLLQTVERYAEQRTPNLVETLAQPIPVRDAFVALANQFIAQIVAGPGRRGCYLGNCAAELPRGERAALAKVRDGLAGTETIFGDALRRAKARGELAQDADPTALARFLTAAFQGLRLIGKVNPDRDTLTDIATTMLQCLNEPSSPRTTNQKHKQGNNP